MILHPRDVLAGYLVALERHLQLTGQNVHSSIFLH
jgi:hypothetical protein